MPRIFSCPLACGKFLYLCVVDAPREVLFLVKLCFLCMQWGQLGICADLVEAGTRAVRTQLGCAAYAPGRAQGTYTDTVRWVRAAEKML